MNRFNLKYNVKIMEERRRKLRNNMTHTEVILWNCIRRKQIHGVRFRRQFSIREFIVDFYSPELFLVVEVDGPIHFTDEEIEYDIYRRSELENFGLTFLRIRNDDIYKNIEGVVKAISMQVESMLFLKKTPSLSPTCLRQFFDLIGGDKNHKNITESIIYYK